GADDAVPPGLGEPSARSGPPPLVRDRRLGGTAARRQSGRGVRAVRPRARDPHLPPRAPPTPPRPPQNTRRRPSGPPVVEAAAVNRRITPAERLAPGDRVDDFHVWEHIHSGAQSVLYRVTGRDTGFPLLMKVPRFRSGDPAQNLLSYETETLIL